MTDADASPVVPPDVPVSPTARHRPRPAANPDGGKPDRPRSERPPALPPPKRERDSPAITPPGGAVRPPLAPAASGPSRAPRAGALEPAREGPEVHPRPVTRGTDVEETVHHRLDPSFVDHGVHEVVCGLWPLCGDGDDRHARRPAEATGHRAGGIRQDREREITTRPQKTRKRQEEDAFIRPRRG